MALAADTSEDRIVLEPAPAEADEPADSAAKPVSVQAPGESKARAKDHPPIARASVISDLREAAKCASGTGRSWVVVNGPGDVRVAGWAQCSGGTWSLDVTTGSGHVGGMTLQADDFAGTITIPRQGTATSNVRVRLPWVGSTLPKGTAAAALVLAPAGRELGGTVNVIDSAKAGRITMSGKVLANGTFVLKANGDVLFAGKSVPMSGVYRSGANRTRGGTQPTWNFSGVGTDVKVPGASFDRPRLTMSHAAPGIQGTGQVTIARYDLRSPVRIAVLDGTSWNASLLGAKGGVRKDPRLAGLVLRTDGATGSISSVRGRIQWNIRMPMTLVDGALTLRGNATMLGPDRLRLAPIAGVGDLFGVGRQGLFGQAAGTLVLDGRSSSGRLAVGAVGEQLVDMPAGWMSTTVVELTPRFTKGGAAELDRDLKVVLTKGLSRVVLAGGLPRTGPFTLKAGGHLRVEGTDVPVRGAYIGSGPRQSSTPARMVLRANTDDAPRRRAALGPGVWLSDTVIVYSTQRATVGGPVTRAASLPKVSPTMSGSTVTLNVTTTSGEVITLSGTATMEDGQYVVTVSGQGDEVWEPYDGLSIPVSEISGTIYADDSKSVNAWELETGEVTWDIANGITLTTTLMLSSDCPLEENCPEDDGSSDDSDTFYVGGSSQVTGIPPVAGVTIPDLDATGAFLADGSWVRWDATTSDAVQVEGPADTTISMNNATVTIFSGERSDTIPDLDMPDLSAITGPNGVNVQICGTFEVTILSFDTGEQEGCVGSTEFGKVLGQTQTGGTVSPTDEHNGLALDSKQPPTLTGFAWSDIDPKLAGLSAPPVMGLFDQALSLVPKKNSLTANVVIPGSLMKTFGTGIDSDTSFTSTGWFETNGNFFLDLDVPVNLKASGVSLQNIDVSVGRTKDSTSSEFDFALDATGEVAVSSHHYPFDAKIEIKAGSDNEAMVSLAVMGDVSSTSVGEFDDTGVLTEGDFEPPTTSEFDGTFDSEQPGNDFADGGFEAGTPAHNLIDNASFEDSASLGLLPADVATLQGDVSGNLLPNPGFDDTDVITNGDFEGVSGSTGTSYSQSTPLFWAPAGSTNLAIIRGDAGPTAGDDTQVMSITNTGTSVSDSTGAMQKVQISAQPGVTYRLSGWARPDQQTSSSITAMVKGPDTAVVKTSKSLQWMTWSPFTVDITPTTSGSSFTIYLQASAGVRIAVDEVTFGPISATTSTSMSGVGRPDIVMDFENADNKPYFATRDILYPTVNGSRALHTFSCEANWSFNSSSMGYVDGDFDMSTVISFPSNAGREIANVGFYLDTGGGYAAKGYVFRLQTEGGDGGFYQATGSSSTDTSSLKRWDTSIAAAPNASIGKSYRVHLMSYGGKVSVEVVDLSNNSVFFAQTVSLPSNARTSGVFGQFPDSYCSSATALVGHYWDDITVTTPTGASGVYFDSSKAYSAPGYAQLGSSAANWGYMTEVDRDAYNGETYTYSVWLRAASGTVTGNLRLLATGASGTQTAVQPFSVGTSWTNVRVTNLLNADVTSLRVGITDVGSSATLYADDQSLQHIPWTTYPGDDYTETALLDVVPDPDDATNNVMLIDSQAVGGSAYYWTAKPFATSVYHLTARVRSATGTAVSGNLHFYDGDGSNHSVSFTADSAWKTVGPIDVTSVGGSNSARVAFDAAANTAGYLVDDVTLTATETTSGQTAGSLGVLQPAVGWTAGTLLVNSPGNARTGEAYLRISPGGASTSYTMAAPSTVDPGQSFAALAWIKAPGGGTTQVKATLATLDANGNTLDTVDSNLTLTNTSYQRMLFTLPITKTGTKSLKLTLQEVSGASWIAIDDVAVGLEGLTLKDPWYVSGQMGLVAVDDSSIAHSGTNVLRLKSGSSSSGTALLDADDTPVTGMRAFTAYMKSTTSSTVTVKMTLSQKNGSSKSASFKVGPSWGLGVVTLPVTAGTRNTFTSSLNIPAGSAVLVDDLVTRDVSPFTPTTTAATAVVVSDSSNSSTSSSTTKSTSSQSAGSGVRPRTYFAGPPSAPTNVKAALATSNSIKVTWNNPYSGNSQVYTSIDGYRVKDGSGRQVCDVSGSVTTCTDSNLKPGSYQYQVQSYNEYGQSSYSSKTSTITIADDATDALVLGSGSSSPSNYLMVATTGAGSVDAPITVTSSEAVDSGSTFTVRANVKAATGKTISGTVGLTFGGSKAAGAALSPQLQEGDSASFTVGDSWTKVTATFRAPSGGPFTKYSPTFSVNSAGTFFVDSVTVTPVEIEQDDPWTAVGSSSWGVFDDPDDAHDGSLGVLTMSTSGTAASGVSKSWKQNASSGQVYSASAWVRAETSKNASVTMDATASGGGSPNDVASSTITVNDDWQLVNLRLPITKSRTDMQLRVLTTTPGVKIYVDDVTVVQNPWTDNGVTKSNIVGNGSFESSVNGWSANAGAQIVRTDALGFAGTAAAELVRGDGQTGDNYVVYDLKSAAEGSTQYTVSAYVWLPSGAAASDTYQGRDLMWAVDYGQSGTIATAKPDFTKTDQWQRISTTITTAPAQSLNVRFYVPTGGGWYIDGVMVQGGKALGDYFDGQVQTTTMDIIGGGDDAYEGTGFARITNSGSTTNAVATVSRTLSTPLSGQQYVTAWVRTPGTADVSGTLTIANGCTASQAFSARAGEDWSKVEVGCSLSSNATPTISVNVSESGSVLDVDSIVIGAERQDNPFQSGDIMGVTTPLTNPETGYDYLWDDAFGIPGMHLWAVTASVEIDEGEPGLGLQATVYQDPTRVSHLLFGNTWIKGDAYVNIDEADPCFGFDFLGVDGQSGVEIADGALKATDFSINVAPRGCAIGDYVVPMGESIEFDGMVGDGTVHFLLEFTEDEEGTPEFIGDVAVTNLNIGGVDYRDLEMSVLVTPTDSSVKYVADMELPNGSFNGEFDMEGNDEGVHVHGDVDLTDWAWSSSSMKGLQVEELSFDMDMDVGDDNCSTFDVDAKGVGTLGNKTSLDFDYVMNMNCGELEELELRFDYTHGSITEDLYLTYDANSHELTGGVDFFFENRLSWKVLGHRYHRTARINVTFDFSMDTTAPSSAVADLYADIKVADGEGTADCEITGQPSDHCDISISVKSPILGHKHFSVSW
jgi:hypothetical protein